ncbi:MAG: Phosphomannomutase, partial [Myxococcaceae bacterium]|nr:Phosphomannomutase [Myxococcaceae bacterium]
MDLTALKSLAEAWLAHDVDPTTRAEVAALLSANNQVELEDRFGSRLEFGTAGLRGVLGGGPNRMNRAVVLRTTAGLARYLKANVPDVATRGVVVCRDGRKLSEEFTVDVAQVLAAEGIPALVFPTVGPTPLCAFAVLHLKAAAAVMVTASHNPPEYNGYKVYWANGAQIIPPHDVGIAAAIDQVEPADEVKVLAQPAARQRNLWRDIGPQVERAYVDAILALRPTRQTAGLKVVYTAMHGVGGALVQQALTEAGFTHFFPVAEQFAPDGDFPTVRFPNPEEKGALDLATALAEKQGADLVLANDPDADRLAAMARDSAGKLRMLTGNELGVLLGHFLLSQPGLKKPLVITTIVSSAQLKSIAAAMGATYEETLTGFKWIANRALALLGEGQQFVFGYEEALGYTVGTVARDKDGIGAALVTADMAAWCKARGTTLLGYLEEVQRAHGLFVARQASFTLPGTSGAATIGKVMKAFRDQPPAQLGEWKVEAVNDYQQQTRLALPKSNVLAYELA